jgi:hypothetical protein
VDGIVTFPQSSTDSIQEVRKTEYRPVCFTAQQQAPNILCVGAGPRSLGSGQPVHKLGGSVGLRVPTDLPDSQGPQQGQDILLQSPPHCSMVAPPTMVPGSPPPLDGHPSTSASEPQTITAEAEHTVLPRTRAPEAGRMASLRECLLSDRVPPEAEGLVMAGWRPGTLRVYTAQFNIFSRWCQGRGIHPNAVSVTEVLSFVHHLFDKGLQYNTLCVYRSMLSNAIPQQGA